MTVRPSPRVLLVVVALPLLLMLERLAWYGTRSVQYLHLNEIGWDSSEIGTIFGVQAVLMAVVTVVSGLLALAVGPVPLISLGLLLACAGYAMVPMFGPESVQVPIYLSMVGTAIFRPAIWAALLIPLARPRESARIGACILLYVASNLGAVPAAPGASWLMDQFGGGAVYTAAAGIAGLGLLLSLAVAGGWLASRSEELSGPPTPAMKLDLPLVLAAAGLGLLLWLPWMGLMTASRPSGRRSGSCPSSRAPGRSGWPPTR
jgi:dipeptide/tripeptide permease